MAESFKHDLEIALGLLVGIDKDDVIAIESMLGEKIDNKKPGDVHKCLLEKKVEGDKKRFKGVLRRCYTTIDLTTDDTDVDTDVEMETARS